MMQTSASNAASREQYEQQLKIRSAKWDATRAVWNNKLVDYKGEYSSNQEAAGRAWASEQYRLNEQFQQAAFQKQDMLAQLIGAQGQLGASEQTGRTAGRLQMEQVAAYGRNNAIIAENLASARGAMMQRNEDIRRQMISQNNRAWSEVAMSPVGDLTPPPPIMQGQGANILGMVAGIGSSVLGGIGKNKAPNSWDGTGAAPMGYDTRGLQLNPGSNFSMGNHDWAATPFEPGPISTGSTSWAPTQWGRNNDFGANVFGSYR